MVLKKSLKAFDAIIMRVQNPEKISGAPIFSDNLGCMPAKIIHLD